MVCMVGRGRLLFQFDGLSYGLPRGAARNRMRNSGKAAYYERYVTQGGRPALAVIWSHIASVISRVLPSRSATSCRCRSLSREYLPVFQFARAAAPPCIRQRVYSPSGRRTPGAWHNVRRLVWARHRGLDVTSPEGLP